MSGPTRIGGRVGHDGVASTWSVADGSRGRRWREASTDSTGKAVVLAIETDPAGRFLKLEAGAGDALLTLHREPDDSLHGHLVTPAGVQHLALGRLAPPLVEVVGSRLADAALVGALGDAVGVGEGVTTPVVSVSRSLATVMETRTIRRLEAWRWSVATADDARVVALDPAGLPDPAAGEERWPLER